MYDYNPLNEVEAQRARYQLLNDGVYDAYVDSAVARPSNAGNPMVEVTLTIRDRENRLHYVKDFLLFTDNMIWKLKHICDSAGISEVYANRKFHHDLIVKKRVKVRIITQVGKEIPIEKLNGKPAGSLYPDKNVVEDYISRDNMQVEIGVLHMMPSNAALLGSSKNDFIDSEIPF